MIIIIQSLLLLIIITILLLLLFIIIIIIIMPTVVHHTYVIESGTVEEDQSTICHKFIQVRIVLEVLRLQLGTHVCQVHGVSNYFVVVWNLLE